MTELTCYVTEDYDYSGIRDGGDGEIFPIGAYTLYIWSCYETTDERLRIGTFSDKNKALKTAQKVYGKVKWCHFCEPFDPL